MSQIFDAVPLPGGGVLVARGDAGVELVEGPSGGQRRPFACVAQSLALSLDGRHAIAVPPQRSKRPFHWLDLAARTIEPWPLDGFTSVARTFESPLWYVVGGARDWVQALRVTARGTQEVVALDREEVDWPGSVRLCGDRLYVECSSLGAFHYEIRELPSLRLVEVGDFIHPLITPGGGSPRFGMYPPVADEFVFVMVKDEETSLCGRLGTWRVPVPGRPIAFDASGPWAAIMLWVRDRCNVLCFRLGEHYPRFMHTFSTPLLALDPAWMPAPSARNPFPKDSCGGIRIDLERLVAWDPHGEIIAADLNGPHLTSVFRAG